MTTGSDDYRGGRVIAATFFGLLLPISAMVVRTWVKARTEPTATPRAEDWLARAALVGQRDLRLSHSD